KRGLLSQLDHALDRGPRAEHLVHRPAEAGKEVHDRLHEPAGPWQHDDLRLVPMDRPHDSFADGGRGRGPEPRQLQPERVAGSLSLAGAVYRTEDDDRGRDSPSAVVVAKD